MLVLVSLELPVKLSSGRIAIASLACQMTPTDAGYPMVTPTLPLSCAAVPRAHTATSTSAIPTDRTVRIRLPPIASYDDGGLLFQRSSQLLEYMPKHQFA